MGQTYQKKKPSEWKETNETERTGQMQMNGKPSKRRETKEEEKISHDWTNAHV